MFYAQGYCMVCGSYYELPRQDDEASVCIHIRPDQSTAIFILCNNQTACQWRRDERVNGAIREESQRREQSREERRSPVQTPEHAGKGIQHLSATRHYVIRGKE